MIDSSRDAAVALFCFSVSLALGGCGPSKSRGSPSARLFQGDVELPPPDAKVALGPEDLSCPEPGLRAVELVGGNFSFCARTSDDRVWCWGAARARTTASGIFRLGSGHVPMEIPGLRGAAGIAMAQSAGVCGITPNKTVKCFGWMGDKYESGVGMKAMPELSGVKQITGGGSHACALTEEGTVYCWGSNYYGQIGNGVAGFDGYTPATRVEGLSDIRKVVAGGYHTCALRGDGRVLCWGNNKVSQCGAPSNKAVSGAPSTHPILVRSVEGVTDLVLQELGTCVLVRDGSVKCWSGTFGADHRPVTVQDTAGLVRLVSDPSSSYVCGVMRDGSTRCWEHDERPLTLLDVPRDAVDWAFVSRRWLCARLKDGRVLCGGRSETSHRFGEGLKEVRW